MERFNIAQYFWFFRDAAIVFVIFYAINAFMADRMQAPSVIAYIGFHGSGKTLHCVQEALKAYKDPFCERIYSTVHIKAERAEDAHKFHFIDPNRWQDNILEQKLDKELVRKGHYYLWIVDEASLLMPARAHKTLPPQFWSAIALARKSGWKIRWATQAEARVDLMMREVTMWVYECERFAPIANNLWAFTTTRRHATDAGVAKSKMAKADKSLSGRQYIMRWQCARLYRAYDTLDAVELAQHLQGTPDLS